MTEPAWAKVSRKRWSNLRANINALAVPQVLAIRKGGTMLAAMKPQRERHSGRTAKKAAFSPLLRMKPRGTFGRKVEMHSRRS